MNTAPMVTDVTAVRPAPRASRRGLALTVLALAQFVVVLDASIVNIALRPSAASFISTPPR
jgi:hypothetical protein